MMLAITGAGMVTSLGMDKDECFAAFCAGASGSRPTQGFDPDRFTLKYAFEIADRVAASPDVTGRATKWLCAAIREAVHMSGLTTANQRIAVVVGTGLRELR